MLLVACVETSTLILLMTSQRIKHRSSSVLNVLEKLGEEGRILGAVLEEVVQNVHLRIRPASLTQRLAGRFWKLMDHSGTVMAKWTPPAFTSAVLVTCVFMEVSSLHCVIPWQRILQSAFPTRL